MSKYVGGLTTEEWFQEALYTHQYIKYIAQTILPKTILNMYPNIPQKDEVSKLDWIITKLKEIRSNADTAIGQGLAIVNTVGTAKALVATTISTEKKGKEDMGTTEVRTKHQNNIKPSNSDPLNWVDYTPQTNDNQSKDPIQYNNTNKYQEIGFNKNTMKGKALRFTKLCDMVSSRSDKP